MPKIVLDGSPPIRIREQAQLTKMAETIKTDILSHLDVQGIELFDDVYAFPPESLRQLVAQTTKQLDETIEKSQSPLKVSLIGPFASGKTVTLGSLLNRPDLLPRSATPTSGNVVEVQIVPPQSSNDTKIMQCHLFSLLELEDMLRDYYAYLLDVYKLSELSDPKKRLPEQPGFLRERIQFLCTDIRRLLETKWTQHRQGQMRFPFRGLSHLAHLYFILLTIRHYLQNYPQISNTDALVLELPYGYQEKDAQERLIAVTMLDMQWALNDMNPTQLEQKVQRLTATLPVGLDQLTQACHQETCTISNEALRALLPLYKRIVLTQEMELKDWTGAERITFVDFPGIGSDNRRDVYLCMKALPETHANMLFFLANRPTVKEAQPLIDIIMEAKLHLNQLANRLIPAINFFDNYAELPAEVDEAQETNHPEAQQRAWQRVQDFFSKPQLENVDGLKVGFDVFDQSILGQLFTNQEYWNYFLLSPVVSIDDTLLTDKERVYLSIYQDQRARYGQLLQDLNTTLKHLKAQDRQQYATEIDKYERLKDALSAYQQQDGGISFLREELIDKLKKNGLKLILEDALPPLQTSLQQLDSELITKLREKVNLGNLGDDSAEAIENKAARDRVLALWDRMYQLTRHWAGAGQIRLMHRGHVTEPREPRDNEDVDPLQLCEAQVLRTVLENDFWQEWAQRWIAQDDKQDEKKKQKTPLTELVEQYHALEERLDTWTTQAIQETLADTLERLDAEEREISVGGQQVRESFHSLRNTLEQDYLRGDKLEQDEKAALRNWFSLTSLADDIRAQLDQLKQQQHKYFCNKKVPFNENQNFNWTAVEMMKIQRQVILTLQRRVAHEFAFYTSNFAGELQRRLNNCFFDRENSLDGFKAQCSATDGIFDRLAQIPLSEEVDEQVDAMNRREKQRKADEKAALILTGWNNLGTVTK